MRIRTKFLAVLLVELIGFIGLSGLSVATFARVREMKTVVENGMSLIARSRRVYSLLKDVVFDLFTPDSYQALRSVVLAPRSLVTGKEFAHETGLFHDEYEVFMQDEMIAYILRRNSELFSAYETAAPLADQAFVKFERLSGLFERVRGLTPAEGKDLYLTVQESKDESLYGVFGEIRDSSFYLNNIFESFLNRFVRGIRLQAESLERAATLTFAIAVLLLGSLTILVVYLLSSGILLSIRNLESAIRKVAEGDFSVHVPIRSKDELGALGSAFQRLADDLKKNVESIPSILKDVNEALPEAPDSETILSILSDALLREGGARSVCVFSRKGDELQIAAKSGFDSLPAWPKGEARALAEFRGILPKPNGSFFIKELSSERFYLESLGFAASIESLLVVPMTVRKKNAGYFLFARDDRGFTDLEFSRLTAIADYAAQVLDSVEVHAALAARHDAGLEALQAQIQPHFMYNVLTSLMALNRMGETKKLEAAIIALKDMLRYALGQDQWTTVSEEFAFLEKYCELQKLRHGNRFDFVFESEEAADDIHIPKLIVQPLVENAFIHGLELKLGPGRLLIGARIEHDSLVIRVQDDGIGCAPAALDTVGDGSLLHERVGLGNVRKRLVLLYKDARLDLAGAEGEGFAALISIPLEECVWA
ncbi:MAG TPA: histidine kinase [Rectinemataceae bacterium]|nr:histidine kinase [Rectinemataceae bacterium]